MRALLRHSLIAGAALAPLLLVSLAGCAPTTSTESATATAPAAGTTATPITTPSLMMPPTTQVASGVCGPHIRYDITFSAANGLAVSQTSGLGVLAYPEIQVPGSQPATPMLAPSTATFSNYSSSAAPIVNPALSEKRGGYVLLICNSSNKAHTLSAVQVSIAAIKPFTDQLGAWAPCQGAYFPTGGYVSGGCGGADFQTEYMHATFAADAQTGAAVTAAQTGTNVGMSGAAGDLQPGPLPVTLQPGQTMTIEVGMTPPTSPGYYTFAFALSVDGASTGVVTYSPTTLIAPVARVWSGDACKTSAMQALIAQMPTPTAANDGYICPAS